MRALYFDCLSGISGDMLLGALIDIGVGKEQLINELKNLNLNEYELKIEKKLQRGISGTDVQFILKHEHHTHDKKHNGHQHGGYHDHEHHGERNLSDINGIIDSSTLKQSVKDLSKKVFEEIARAEAKIHGKPINEVHFHEVGAVDSIVDIVGTAICLDILGIERMFSSALHDGTGTIECRHGVIPVPVPAVMEMLAGSGIPLITEDINTELVTPTGAGLIKSITSHFGKMPPIIIEKVGYGFGKRETGRLNALRIVMGEIQNTAGEDISVLETNIDDTSPEILGYTMEKLIEAGALDVFYIPIYMKKNRPAAMLSVITKAADEEKLVKIILTETSSIGVRKSVMERYRMDREIIKVSIEYGEIAVKVSSFDGVKKFAPEYEECREIARKTGMPIRNVFQMVMERLGNLN